jgi:hypothetical protein
MFARPASGGPGLGVPGAQRAGSAGQVFRPAVSAVSIEHLR